MDSGRPILPKLLRPRSFQSIMVYIRQHNLVKFLSLLVLFLLLFRILVPNLFSYSLSYFQIIITMVNTDMDRQQDVIRQEAELVWGYHQMQKRFMQQICKEKKLSKKKYLWLVSLSSDNVLPGAVAVAQSIQKISCYTNIGAMVTPNVSNLTRSVLAKAGYQMFDVESLDCNWLEKSLHLPPTNTGIPGTHTRFHAWNLLQFEKIAYVDIDYMLLTNIDEIFDLPGDLSAVYCARPSVVQPCFNAGLAVFRPSAKTHSGLMDKWKELNGIMGCVSDQVVMWYYFAFSDRWNPLPYSYNVRRKLFYPMKAYHFAGYGVTPKPWDMKIPPTKKEAFDFPGPAVERKDMNFLWWQLFYNALDQYNLHQWWTSR
ncbi:glycogenin-1-like isoform X2 [Dendronephthya gigantea]|uniref:glycogenin-1-like isoform X2 n=1 Tax=Dendronephthya gigantea TaxID=151771 RepID=UPI00106C3B99|nr:glycogenin-1-like isoform X2 [Dendronephthya gigantea]